MIFFLSHRFLLGRKKSLLYSPLSLLAFLSLSLTLAIALSVFSVMDGLEKTFMKAVLGFNAHITIVSDEETKNWDEELALIKDPKFEVVGSTPYIFREGLLLLPGEVSGVVIKGVDAKMAEGVYNLKVSSLLKNAENTTSKTYAQLKGEGAPLILGKALFDRLGSTSPDLKVQVLFPPKKGDDSQSFSSLKHTFKVVGVFESGNYEFDSKFALVDNSTLDTFLKLEGKRKGYELALKNPKNAKKTVEAFEEKNINKTIVSWEDLNGTLISAMKREKIRFFIVMSLVMVLATFNLVGLQVLLVLGKRREVFLLEAMGASKPKIEKIFLTQGFFIGLVSMILGTIEFFVFFKFLQRGDLLPIDPKVFSVTQFEITWPWLAFGFTSFLTLFLSLIVSLIVTKLLLKNKSIASFIRI